MGEDNNYIPCLVGVLFFHHYIFKHFTCTYVRTSADVPSTVDLRWLAFEVSSFPS